MNIFEWYDKYEYILRIVIPILALIIGYFINSSKDHINRMKLRKLFSLKKTESQIILPAISGQLENSESGAVSFSEPTDFVTYEEALILSESRKFIDDLRDKNYTMAPVRTTEIETNKNAFYFGGFRVHDFVLQRFKKEFQAIKFGCSHKSYENVKYRDICIPVDGHTYKIFLNGEELLSYGMINGVDERYIILIKLTGEADFANRDHGTVHICFGNDKHATLSSAKCFNENRNELHKRLKHRKNHYFVIAKCSTNNAIDFTTFRDLTDEVFKPEED